MLQSRTMSSCLYVVAKCTGAPAPLSCVQKYGSVSMICARARGVTPAGERAGRPASRRLAPHLGQLLRVAQAHVGVEGKRREARLRRVAPRACAARVGASVPRLSGRGAAQARAAARSAPVMSRPMAAGLRATRAEGPVGAERACVICGQGRQARGNAWKGDRHVRLDGQRAAGTQRPPDVACQRCALAQAVQRHRQRTCQRPASVRASKQRGANGALPSSQQWW